MRPIILKFFLSVFCIVLTIQTNAQTCTGSLGDPVINQDFGSGTAQGGPLAAGITDLTYTSSKCPDDGYYTITNGLNAPSCYGTWQNVTHDHTGNPNGYMMVVNASYQPNIFFTQTANGLCPNTTYEFSSYVLNLITLEASGPNVSEPNIAFTIETTSGQILATDTTGTIASTPQGSPTWNKYGVYFTTPVNVTDIIVKMNNIAPGGNGNDLVLDDITFRACGPIIETGFASTTGPASIDLCENQNASYTIQAAVVGNNSPTYQWQLNTNNNGWADIAGQTNSVLNVQFTNAITGTYQYRVGVANGSDISSVSCRVYSSPLTVNVNPLPVVPAIATQTICEGYPLQLSATGGASYIWSGPDLAPTMQNPLTINNVTPANAGTYYVQAISSKGCPAPLVSAVVKVVPKVIAVAGNDVTVCAGEPTQLIASGGLYYKWTPLTGLDHDDIADPVATPHQTTTYAVNVSNDGCNDDTKSTTVTVRQNPVAIAGANKVIFEGQSVKLDGAVTGDEITGYYWTPATGLNNPTSLTPVANPTSDITYTLNVISKNCGSASSTIFVRVYKKITIPNTFSPNNDGINDYWNIDALVTYPECLITVFDRYGQQVFQSAGYARPWNGTNNGAPLPVGTYYYIIDLKNNTPKLGGWVLIVR